MKRALGILTSTHVDLDSERMSPGAIESMVAAANAHYIPVGIEHDPRIPPVGRVASAHVKQLDDGEYAVVGVLEYFEPGEEIELKSDGREIPTKHIEPDRLYVSFDRSFRRPEYQKLIEQISEVFKTPPSEQVKKAIDPVSLLEIGGAFVLGSIAKEFCTKLGSDGYERVKTSLGELFSRKRAAREEAILVFRADVTFRDSQIEIQVFVTNPTADDIDQFLERALAGLDEAVARYWDVGSGLRRMVFEYHGGTLEIRFGVRRDAVPLWSQQPQ
jgi:hypothetical protein